MGTPALSISRTYFRVLSVDPTRTITLRQRFVREFRRRFRLLMADVREAVVDLDVFGLTGEQPRANAAGLSTGAFAFPTNSRKIDEFIKWLDGKSDEYLLGGGATGVRTAGELVGGTDLERARQSWMNSYIDSSYQQGIRRARQELRKAGLDIDEGQMGGDPIRVAFNGPIHADRVGLIYTRAYSSLKGITAEMDSTVSDVLAMAMTEGRHPREMARMLDRVITGDGGGDFGIVDSLGRRIPSRRRAEILARTETIRAHHAANMGEYRAAGALGITVLAEHLTAGDARVCPQCAPLQGKRYELDEAEHMIPVHPQCRCVAIPYIPEDEDEPEEAVEEQAFMPAASIKAAEEYALANKYAEHVSYEGLDLRSANAINEAMHENIRLIPGLRGLMGFLGTNAAERSRARQFYLKERLKDMGVEKLSDLPSGMARAIEEGVDNFYNDMKMQPNVWAHAAPNYYRKYGIQGISVNEEHFRDFESLTKEATNSVLKKFHPHKTDSVKAIVDHEIAHIIDMVLDSDELVLSRSVTGVINTAYTSRPMAKMRKELSEYARESPAEMLAEGWAEYLNNPNPRPLAREIGEFILSKRANSGLKPKAWTTE